MRMRIRVPRWMPVLGCVLGVVSVAGPDPGARPGGDAGSGAARGPGPRDPMAWVFQRHPDGGFQFDTGILRGRLRAGGASMGLQEVTHIPSGRRLDRSNGVLSHYRVFTRGTRYGGGAWDWPGTASISADRREVRVVWAAAKGRPFELSATYTLPDASSVEVLTEVRALEALPGFEVFLASYFSEAFDRARVALPGDPAAGQGAVRWVPATRERGEWQIHPRDPGAVLLIRDGRWLLEPNPVAWEVKEYFAARPMVIRETGGGGLMCGIVSGREDCFAVALPHQTEAHGSVYLSLFGRTLAAGESATARARWIVAGSVAEFVGRATGDAGPGRSGAVGTR